MAYFTRTNAEGEIKATDLVWLLDDDGDDEEDSGLFDALRTRSQGRVDGILARRYDVPFADGAVPEAVREGTLMVFCANLYRRRGTPDDENAFAEREKEALELFKKAAAGEAELDVDLDAVGAIGSIYDDNDLDWELENQEGI